MNDLIYGKRKQGKSTFALADAITRNRRVVIWDPNNMYPLIRSIHLDMLPDWVSESRETESGKFNLVRVGPLPIMDLMPDYFAGFSDILLGERDISIIVDEAQMLQGPQWIDPNLDRLMRQSPASVALIQTTHRIVNAHIDSRYHADNVFFFFADLPKELKTIAGEFGERTAELVPTLKPYQLVRYYRVRGGIPRVELWDDGARWYIDLENGNHA
jgi:hypothetical protein